MRRPFWIWVCWFLFLFFLDFFIPFRLLNEVPGIAGSFLFWVIWMVVAMASMFIIFLRWREDGSRGKKGGNLE